MLNILSFYFQIHFPLKCVDMQSTATAALVAVSVFLLSMQQHGMEEVADPSSQTNARSSDVTNFLKDVSGTLKSITELPHNGPTKPNAYLIAYSEASHTTHNLQKVLDEILEKLSVATNTITNIYIPKLEELGDVASELETNATLFLQNCMEEYDKLAAELATCQNNSNSENETKGTS